MRSDGSDARRIVSGCGARWSADGARLVYGSARGDLFVFDLKNGKTDRLTSTPAYEEAAGWSPNGKKILFTRSRSGETGYVFVMNADGSHARKLASGHAGCWSPDGRKILYTRFFSSALYVMNANGRHKHRILRAFASEPDWR
jgi:Tol biopolymer transport system component